MLLLGSVKEVNELNVVVSLPNNLKGIISITEVSDVLNTLLQKELNDPDSVMKTFSLSITLICFSHGFNNKIIRSLYMITDFHIEGG
jgi:hypothetical protein